jgi:dihydroorotate dehydrogenase electron transfer subunit
MDGSPPSRPGVAGGESARRAAPLGRRLCEVTANRASGGYRVFSLRDEQGPEPEPGQFYMLATERRWGEAGGRPFLPRALSVADAEAGKAVRLDFLVAGVGPGTERLCALEVGEAVWVNGPLGNGFSQPRELVPGAAGAILVGGGIGIAPLALLRRRFSARGVPAQILLGFRDRAHSGGLDDLFSNCQIGLASDDGHLGEQGRVTDLLLAMLTGDDAGSAAVYACGPPAMLEGVRAMCAERGIACELALESPMACGFGACYGCAVPLAAGGYMRLCVDGPVVRGEQVVASDWHPSAAGPEASEPGARVR